MNKIEKKIREYVQHYNPKKYWKYREIVINKENKCNILKNIFRDNINIISIDLTNVGIYEFSIFKHFIGYNRFIIG